MQVDAAQHGHVWPRRIRKPVHTTVALSGLYTQCHKIQIVQAPDHACQERRARNPLRPTPAYAGSPIKYFDTLSYITHIISPDVPCACKTQAADRASARDVLQVDVPALGRPHRLHGAGLRQLRRAVQQLKYALARAHRLRAAAQ